MIIISCAACIPTHSHDGNKKSATVMMMNYLYQRNPALDKVTLQFIAPLDVRERQRAVLWPSTHSSCSTRDIARRKNLRDCFISRINSGTILITVVISPYNIQIDFIAASCTLYSREALSLDTVCVTLIIHNILHVSHRTFRRGAHMKSEEDKLKNLLK